MTKATVLISTLNERPEWLIQAIESNLANQESKQIIISTVIADKNFTLLREYQNKELIEVCYCSLKEHPGRSHAGIYYQINSAVHLIKGEWFYYISSNDIVSKTKMRDEITKCESENKQVCYSAFNTIDENGKETGKRTFRDKYNYPAHIRGNYISDASLIKTDLLKKYLPYRNDLYGNLAHWDLWLRIFEGEGDVFAYNPIPAFWYRQNNDSMHNVNKHDAEKINIRKLQEENLRAYNDRYKQI